MTKNTILKVVQATAIIAPLALASSAFALDTELTMATAGTLVTSTITAFGVQVLLVLGGIVAIMAGYFLFKWGWRKIKGSVK
jgi:hypothetical protein